MNITHIKTTLLTRNPLPVQIIRVESPTLFWVQLKYNKTTLLELQEDLEWVLKRRPNRYILLPHAIIPGRIVAVRNLDQWCRGTVTATRKGIAFIRLDDWGKCVVKASTDIYKLPDQFYLMPWQTISCSLYNTKPAGPSLTWSTKAKQLIKLLAEGEEGWMKIRRTISSQSAEVEMQMSRPNRLSYSSLRTELIDLGQAETITSKY
ncbi:hypothetical protein EAI_09045 [Harpegnathos saltator]|uniref:Tudor domain-containing protein n=1 Tax=Harpegnathos saltator TaxID=610380 RepID=E2BZF6_HARSA|nr:hypothetical protein EAI_09045 [Harpegnathos saltator]